MTTRSARLRAVIKRWALPLAILWTLALLSALFLPASALPSSGLLEADKLVHLVLFAGFAGLWMVALGDTLRGAAIYILVLGVSYGVLTELGQQWLSSGRKADPWDAVADTIGVIVGIVAFRIWRRVHPAAEKM